VEYNLELTAAAGAYTSDKTLSLGVQDVLADNLMREFGLSAGDILVALHPWTSDPVKQWPLESFLALAKRLAEFGGLKVVIVGGQEEEGRSRKLFGSQGKGLVDLTGKTTLKELAALLKKCRLLISGDSGPVHLASCVGTPVIALFRNDLPGKTAKRWGPWGSGNSVIEAEGLDRITVDEVFNRLREASGI
jgi:ADP-heptose:LPS heptosyltransferase